MLIYKIFRDDEFAELDSKGETQGSEADARDGFIHFSTAEQLAQTASTHFAGEDGLILAAVDPDTLGDALTWETARDGAQFPHLYRHIRRGDIDWVMPLRLGPDGTHEIPDLTE